MKHAPVRDDVPLLAVGLVAVIRKILFVLSSEEQAGTAELALLLAMIAVFVAALILVSRFDRSETAGDGLAGDREADHGDRPGRG